MADLSAQANTSNLAYHLSDSTLAPILSSSNFSRSWPQRRPESNSQALISLTSSALTAYDSASRLGMGIPQRIMVESRDSGPVILHSYLNPQGAGNLGMRGIFEQAREELRPLSTTSEAGDGGLENREVRLAGQESLLNGLLKGVNTATGNGEDGTSMAVPPLLIATVVAPSAADAGGARRMAARLESIGREFQREWVSEQVQKKDDESTGDGEVEDG